MLLNAGNERFDWALYGPTAPCLQTGCWRNDIGDNNIEDVATPPTPAVLQRDVSVFLLSLTALFQSLANSHCTGLERATGKWPPEISTRFRECATFFFVPGSANVSLINSRMLISKIRQRWIFETGLICVRRLPSFQHVQKIRLNRCRVLNLIELQFPTRHQRNFNASFGNWLRGFS